MPVVQPRSMRRALAVAALAAAVLALLPATEAAGDTRHPPAEDPVTGSQPPGLGAPRARPPVPLPDRPKGLPAQATWGAQIESFASYQPQQSCAAAPLPGTAALRDLALRTYGQGHDGGAIRSCASGGQSEHKEGRAWDWMLDVHDRSERRIAGHFLGWLLAPGAQGRAAAMARRLGVMYVIYNRKIWSAYSPGWRDYTGSSPHTDHIHISLSWNGARGTTSFWRGRVSAVDLGTCAFFAGSPAVVASPQPRTTPCPAPVSSPRGSSRPFAWLGNSGEHVRVAQQRLGMPVTGNLGTTMRGRLLGYQQSHDLPRTGALDDPTWASLDPRTRSQSVPDWSAQEAARWGRAHGSPSLHRSSAGTSVYALQTALRLPDRLRTGFLGQQTTRAVRRFRDKHDLAPKPVVNDEVWDLLPD